MIYFPVLRNIKIENYQLYKNDYSDGIEHQLKGGVHLIVGINGLGKTTLLNAIYRLLVGSNEIYKGDDKPLGSSQHRLSKWKDLRYFGSRVEDDATKATITAEISFGKNIVKVKRKLSNLEIISLSVNEEVFQSSQQEYEEQVIKLSGFADFVDFFSVVKYLIFFLEDRSELIWDYRSQFEIFRILFFDADDSRKAAEKYDEAQKSDSLYRNLHAALSKVKGQVHKFNSIDSAGIREEYLAKKAHYIALDELYQEINDEIDKSKETIEKIKLKRIQLKHNFDELGFAIEYEQHTLYQHYFPNVEQTAELLFAHLSSGSGCLVCGNKTRDTEKKLKLALEQHKCPICDTQVNNQIENTPELVSTSIETAETRLTKLEKKSKSIIDAISNIDDELHNEINILESKEERLQEIYSDYERAEKELKKLKLKLPEDDDDIKELEKLQTNYETKLKRIERDRDNATREYASIIKSTKNSLDEVMDKIRKKFDYYSTRLLAEKVFLVKDSESRKIGQGGEKIEFPCFSVSMTSGVFKQSPSKRRTPNEVSESQREFIDLAFRLALIDVVTEGRDAPAMLVMETPEASLDSMFINEASLLFRGFAADQEGKNVFLASTNLNQSQMIPSLLGIEPQPEIQEQTFFDRLFEEEGEVVEPRSIKPIEIKDSEKHIINLLELSAPNRALEQHIDKFHSLFDKAVYPENYRGG